MLGARDVGLLEGEMQIFHFSDAQDRTLFSMANMVNPGSFPLKKMSSFVTPGVTLFSALPGPTDSMVVFGQMLSVAQRLAALFDAELQDDSHSDLTKQTIDHIREEIVEYERRLKLARLSRKTATR
jgi:cell division protein ZipA